MKDGTVRPRALWLALHLVPLAAVVALRIAAKPLPPVTSFVAFALLVIVISAGQSRIVRERGWLLRTALGMALLVAIAFVAIALADGLGNELFGVFAGHAAGGVLLTAIQQRRGAWFARGETGFMAGAAILTALYASGISVAGPVLAFPGFVELAGLGLVLPFYAVATAPLVGAR